MYYPDTWADGFLLPDIEDSINQAAPGKLRVVSVSEVWFCYFLSFCFIVLTLKT